MSVTCVALGLQTLPLSANSIAAQFKGNVDDVMTKRTEGVNHIRAYWKFDTENPLVDASGNGNALQCTHGVSFKEDFASFNGSSSDMRTLNSLNLSDMIDVTVECFVRLHRGALDKTGIVMEHSANYYTKAQCFHVNTGEMGAGAVSGNFRFNDGYKAYNSPINSINCGWHHIALVKNSAAGDISFYLDGVKQSAVRGNSTVVGEYLENEILWIGSRNGVSFYLDADIDDVRITAQALLPGQFLKTRTGNMENLIAYWPFNASSLFKDKSGNGNTLTGNGVKPSGEGAAAFNGEQSGFSTIAPLPLYPYESLTIEWFMKNGGTAQSVVLEASSDYNNKPGAFGIFANAPWTDYISAGFRMNDGYNTWRNQVTTDGKWHHYALVYDQFSTDENVVRFYIDGEAAKTHHLTASEKTLLHSGVLYIGSRGGTELKFIGELDDIRITGLALSPDGFMKERSAPKGLTAVIR